MSNLDAQEKESLTVGSTDLVVKGGSVVKERVRLQWIQLRAKDCLH